METNAAEVEATVRRLRSLARAMDSQWRVPLTGWRVGIDPLLGLLPGGGDAVGLAIGAYTILQAKRLGAPESLLVKMAANIGLDFLVGSVPVLGDLFDAAFKANTRNVELLERWARLSPPEPREGYAPSARHA